MRLSKEKEELLNDIVRHLTQVDNVAAVVLGGSYATGTATENSDLDIGIYYSEKTPFCIDLIRSIATKYSIDGAPTVTGFYEWGPWVNGGAWIETKAGKVDFLYRNIEQVKSTIEKAKKGEWENDFDQQPPYGFSSIMYLAETRYCLPLADPGGLIKELKAEVQIYPAKLKEKIISQSLWSAEFTILHTDYFLKKHDLYSTMGCLTRAVKNIVTALFSINELFPITDKGAIDILANAAKRPSYLKEKIEEILCADKNSLYNNIDLVKEVFRETVQLAKGVYEPLYKFRKS